MLEKGFKAGSFRLLRVRGALRRRARAVDYRLRWVRSASGGIVPPPAGWGPWGLNMRQGDFQDAEEADNANLEDPDPED